MSSSLTKVAKAIMAAFAMSVLAGCIADTAEDSNLPWSSNRSWEGMAPITPSVMDRYE
ncbi:MAG: hypothetical protein IKO87_01290 [Kiritimatiellae bacterium]|nr:hypothetical protein [Kiritimatiellia bacterium]